MAATTIQTRTDVDTDALENTERLLTEILGPPTHWRLGVRLWDGSTLGPSRPATTVVLEHPWSLRRLLLPPTDLNAGEAYIYGDIDIEGQVEGVFPAMDRLAASGRLRPAVLARIASHALQLPAPPTARDHSHAARPTGVRHSLSRDRSAVCYHYDVSNDFYGLWLGPQMQYSCAYFRTPEADLAAAQEAKIEHICRKLRLHRGDRLLDIGCGWGGLLEHAARHHGVTGLGVTLSQEQARLANERFRAAGVEDLVHVEVRDYREVTGEFDKIVSVGMIEHVGSAHLPEFFSLARRLLVPGGTFLNHGITKRWGNPPSPSPHSFVAHYVFPDGELQPISHVLTAAEEAGLEIRDVESLREHYARTLRHWVANLEAAHDQAVAQTDEVTYRIWRIYMAGSAYNFDNGGLSVFQTLLHRPTGRPADLPPTRDDWYA